MMYQHDDAMLNRAFAGFRGAVAPQVRPAGTDVAHATVRRRRVVRASTAAMLAAIAVATPVAAYATVVGDPHGPPAGPGQQNPVAAAGSATPTVSASATPDTSASPTTSASPAATGTATQAPAGGATSTPAAGRCQSTQLHLEVDAFEWKGQAGASAQAEIGFTNTGSRPCTIEGYAGLRLVDGDAQRRTPTIIREKPSSSATVTLAPNATGWTLISWRFMPLADEEDSDPLCGGKIYGLDVQAPGESTWVDSLGATIGLVCEHDQVDVWPVQFDRPSKTGPVIG